ncbi:MAG: helix-turn-helix transcriptional regulator [Gammaproteobacteria bacterium]
MLVWREYRGLTQGQIAGAAGVRQSYIAILERGERQGSVTKLRAIARVLKVGVDDTKAPCIAPTARLLPGRRTSIRRRHSSERAPSRV